MKDDCIGVRKLCEGCKYGKAKGKDVICMNKLSRFYLIKVSSILCAPCFRVDESKGNIEVEKISLGE